MRKMVKAVHFEPGAEIMEDVDQVSEPAIRSRLRTAASTNKAQADKGQ